jgi:aminomethyltransferase
LRLEAAMPLYGHELNETMNPIQAGLAWAVKTDKGEFIGRQALTDAIQNSSQQSQRIGLELEGKRAAREGCQIQAMDGSPTGIVTSGSYVPTLEKSIAMGYVNPVNTSVGAPLIVDIRGTATAAKVVALPFYKRGKS